jgi:hypothetical protein
LSFFTSATTSAIVASPREDDRLRAQRFCHRNGHEANRARSGDAHAFSRNQTAKLGKRIHGGAGRNDQRSFLIRHLVRNRDESIDVVHLVFAETAVGCESVGAVAFVDVAVIEPVVVA